MKLRELLSTLNIDATKLCVSIFDVNETCKLVSEFEISNEFVYTPYDTLKESIKDIEQKYLEKDIVPNGCHIVVDECGTFQNGVYDGVSDLNIYISDDVTKLTTLKEFCETLLKNHKKNKTILLDIYEHQAGGSIDRIYLKNDKKFLENRYMDCYIIPKSFDEDGDNYSVEFI